MIGKNVITSMLIGTSLLGGGFLVTQSEGYITIKEEIKEHYNRTVKPVTENLIDFIVKKNDDIRDKDSQISQLENTISERDRTIESLNSSTQQATQELREQIKSLTSERDNYKKAFTEQQQQQDIANNHIKQAKQNEKEIKSFIGSQSTEIHNRIERAGFNEEYKKFVEEKQRE